MKDLPPRFLPLLAFLLLLACSRGGGEGPPVRVRLEPAFPLLVFNQPVGMVQAPGAPGRWYLFERKGRVLVFAASDSAPSSSVFLDISDRVDASGRELGLLGMAFHPAHAGTPQAFLSYTASGARAGSVVSVVSRFASADSGRTLSASTEERVLTVPQPFPNHKGGQLAFGPDRMLYLGLGDGGSAGDPLGNAQDTHSLLGKFLRLDVDSFRPYAIPNDNPFAGSALGGRGEVFAWGFRNPWRWSFDRATGALWAGDVGQDSWEEIDVVERGRNYGWPLKEGKHCYSAVPCDLPGLADPVGEYSHREGCSITGGFVYRGRALPALAGAFVYADYCTGKVWALLPAAGGGFQPRLLLSTPLHISSFAEDGEGELYALDHVEGRVFRLVPGPSPIR